MILESKLINLDNAPFKIFDLSAMTVSEKVVLKKRLKSELSQVVSAADHIEAQLKRMFSHKFSVAADNCQLLSGNDCPVHMQSPSHGSGDHQASSCLKRKAPDMHKQKIIDDKGSNKKGTAIMERSESTSVVTGTHKCESLQRLSSEKGKDHKMDASKFKQCMLILNKLMNHESGWVFNQPVDPIKLQIPDYTSIISKPMDLGTVRKKLKNKVYLDVLGFAEDVRLTFSNAMRYNPPGNDVHIMAKELNNIFSTKWKPLESKWREMSHASQQPDVRKEHNGTPSSGAVIQKEVANDRISLARDSLSSADRQMLRKDLAKISKGKMPTQLLCFFERFGFHGQNDGRIEVDIDEFDDEPLLELHKLVKSCMNTRPSDSRGLKNTREQAYMQGLCEGTASGDVPRQLCNCQKPSMSSCTNGACSNVNCHCSYHNDCTQSLSDVDSERSSGREDRKFPFVTSHLTRVNVTRGDQQGNVNHDSVAANLPHKESVQHSFPTTPPSTDKMGEEQPVYEEQLSPSKAFRVAVLKSRFADTILKAQQETLLSNGEKGDLANMQQEREKLKRKQREERARIEAQIKAAEAAAQRKVDEEMKLQREREREAARLALQKMEKTVDIDENQEIMKDLEILGYSDSNRHIDLPGEMVVNLMDGFELRGGHGNPLEQLGLFIKKDDLDDEEAEDWSPASGNGDVEEGEIGPT